MGCVQFGICRGKALELKAKHGLSDFVETGTLEGHTSQWAASHFAHVATVDKYPMASAIYNLADCPNVTRATSESVLFLKLLDMSTPTLFWLDAHTNVECPVLEEIAQINRSPVRHVILVDDVNQFGPLPDWPTKAECIRALEDGGRRTVTEFEDVFVAEPCP